MYYRVKYNNKRKPFFCPFNQEERIFHTGIYIPEDITGLQCETLRNSVLYNSGSRIKFGKVGLDGCHEVLLKSVNSIWSDYTKGAALIQNYLSTLKVKEKGDKVIGMRLRNRSKRVIRRGLLGKKGQVKRMKSGKIKQKDKILGSILNRQRATSVAVNDRSDSASSLRLVHNLQNACMKRRRSLRLARNLGDYSVGTIPTEENTQTFETLAIIGSEKKMKYKSINNESNQGSSVFARLFPSASDNASDNNPLIVDVTNINQNKTRKNAHNFSTTFVGKDVECLEEPLNATKLNSGTINSRKRKRNLDRSVEIISQNVKRRNIDSVQNGGHEDSDDSCSIISLGSDDEITVIDSVIHSDNSADIIIDTPPSKSRRHCSDVTVVDISLPQVVSATLPTTLKREEKLENVRRINRKPLLVPDIYKEYTSVLGNKPRSCRPASTARNVNTNSREVSASDCAVLESPNEASSSTKDTTDLGSAPSSSLYGDNLYNPNPSEVRTGLRPIVIDGSNVAMGHTNGRIFSCRGLQICIDYFLRRNHKVIAFVPKFRRSAYNTVDREILDELEKKGLLAFTPSRKIGNRLVVAYDDRYIVQYAAECGGVIVSTDNYRDLLNENVTWRDTIEERLLMFTWVGDVLMFPQDPLGKYGPDLERFLRFP